MTQMAMFHVGKNTVMLALVLNAAYIMAAMKLSEYDCLKASLCCIAASLVMLCYMPIQYQAKSCTFLIMQVC